MDLRPSDEQQQLVEAFRDLYEDASSPDRVRAAEPLGHSSELWDRLVATGAVEMAVAEDAGGGGASLLDLALVAEQHGRHVAPAPLIEAQVAARLLGRLPAAAGTLAAVLAGEKLVSIAVRPARSRAAALVPAGAVADAVIVLDDDRLVLTPVPGDVRHVVNTGAMPLADIPVAADATELAQGAGALTDYAAALDEWRVLTAAA